MGINEQELIAVTSAARDTITTGGGSPAREEANRPVRLSINLGAQPAAALRELMERKGISATEAIRRALSVWKFIEDERERGRGFAVLDDDGEQRVVREVIFHD